MQFPRSHLLLVGLISFSLCTIVIAKFHDDPQDQRFTTESALLNLPSGSALDSAAQASTNIPPEVLRDLANDITKLSTENAVAAPVPTQTWSTEIETEVKPGDNLALIFKRHGLSPRDVYLLSTSKPLGARLKNIFPGHAMVLRVDQDKQLIGLTYTTGPLDTLEFSRNGDMFVGEQITAEPERLLAYKHGAIDHSLFVASQRAGLDDGLTMRLAQIFQWDVDFVLDIRPGDAFYVLYEELYLKNEFIGYGNILAAEFVNQGEHYQAIQYTDQAGDNDYYAPDGNSMRKAFLRAPVSFSRISSNFNLRRVHPLFKTVRPHRGIDYAAPKGTPILAAGDGKVKIASRTKANGNYVIIQHGEQFVTKYLHLSKFGKSVKSGARVKQGQTIGYVGATGWATAPHLHYEFLVNGAHKNPRTVSLPKAKPIDQSDMPRFESHSAQFIALLDTYKSQVSLALAQ